MLLAPDTVMVDVLADLLMLAIQLVMGGVRMLVDTMRALLPAQDGRTFRVIRAAGNLSLVGAVVSAAAWWAFDARPGSHGIAIPLVWTATALFLTSFACAAACSVHASRGEEQRQRRLRRRALATEMLQSRRTRTGRSPTRP